MLDDDVAQGARWRVVRAAGWAYSLGLWRGYAHPEIAIFGWEPRRWGLVNVVAELVSAGVRLAPGSRVDDVLLGGRARPRATVLQKKTGGPVRFEVTEQTRESVMGWITRSNRKPGDHLFRSCPW
jgi:hypothetical protein